MGWLFGRMSVVRRVLGQRYLMNVGNLAICDGREYPIDLVAGF